MNFKKKGKIVLGLTGGISAGKSVAAGIFKDLGAEVICADTLAAKNFVLLEEKIKSYFETADKKEIAFAVFMDPTKKKWLERVLHPLILKDALEIISRTKKKIVIFDLPLLFEAGLEGGFDLVLCIYADYNLRLKRALTRKMTAVDFKQRDAAQMLLEEKAQRANIVFYNNKTRKDLEEKLIKFYKLLTK
ncbi:MAG: dephospho-CoA kinase [Elusimicrobiota bacterium]|jgi:dephospho-CoA kinase|nr:dephospho-CoA kinase [Elusimicrobiota bacterium]